MSEVFIGQNGVSTGPFTLAEVEERLRAGSLSPSSPAIVKGSSAWTTVRQLPGLDPVLFPPAADPLAGLTTAANEALVAFSKAGGGRKLVVLGVLAWWVTLFVSVVTSWITTKTCLYGTSENLLVVSALWLLPLLACFLRGEAWALRALTWTLAVALAGLVVIPDTDGGLGHISAVLSVVLVFGEIGLVVALVSLLRLPVISTP